MPLEGMYHLGRRLGGLERNSYKCWYSDLPALEPSELRFRLDEYHIFTCSAQKDLHKVELWITVGSLNLLNAMPVHTEP